MPHKWTAAEYGRLSGLKAAGATAVEMAAAFDLSRGQVFYHLRKLGLTKPGRTWSATEDGQLRAGYGRNGFIREFAARLGVSRAAVIARARHLGIQAKQVAYRWTEAMVAILRRDWGRVKPNAAVAEALGLPLNNVRRKAARLRLTRQTAPRRPELLPPSAWPVGHDETLTRLNAAGWSDRMIAGAVNYSHDVVSKRRKALALPETTEATAERSRRFMLERRLGRVSAVKRAASLREFASGYGLPGDLTPRAVQVLVILLDGPLTRRQLAERIGRKWFGQSYSGKSGVMASLKARGLIASFAPTNRSAPAHILTATALAHLSSAAGVQHGR